MKSVKAPKTFFPIVVECGMHFEVKLTKKDLQTLFKTLVDLDAFDGVKKIDENADEGISLYSSDNYFHLNVTSDDITLYFFNNDLEISPNSKLDEANRIIQSVIELVNFSVDIVRLRVSQLSFKKVDKENILNEIISPQYVSKVDDDFTVDFDFTDTHNDELLFVKVTTSHTTHMHRVLDAHKLVPKLERSIAVDTIIASIEEELTNADVKKFYTDHLITGILHKGLRKFGYGQE